MMLTTKRKAWTFILFLVMLYCCIGCGTTYHAKRMNYHKMQFIAKGGIVKVDTTYKLLTFDVPAMKFETVLEPLISKEGVTEYVQRSTTLPGAETKVIIKWREKCDSTCVESLKVESNVPKQEIKKEVAIANETTLIPPKNNKWWMWLTVGLCVGFVIRSAIPLLRPKHST